MVARVSCLTGLKIKPICVLVFVVAVMRPVVNAGGLLVRVPGLDLPAARLHLRLSSRAVTTGQVDHRACAVACHQVPAVAPIVAGWNHRPRDAESLPTKSMEDRL